MNEVSPDIDLILQLQNGDKSALYSLYDKYSGALYGVILRMCRDKEMAEDLLQESFVKIWKKIDQYDPTKGKFYTWSYRIAKNTTLNSLRKTSPLIQNEDLGVYEDVADEETFQDFSVLNGVLKNLEPKHQKAIELVYFKGYTHREAHEIMEVPLGTFKSYVRQALLQIKNRYKEPMAIIWLCFEVFSNG
jgi:RNA polymerase sigma-70 factor (ECF subfamily)